MKDTLKAITTCLFLMGAIICNAQCSGTCSKSCNGCTKSNDPVAVGESSSCCSKSEVNAYYFHFSRRCATCMAVEKVAKESLKQYYGDKIALKSINLDEDTNKNLAKKLGVSGQTLLLVKGTKKVNLTNVAFMNARTKPEKLKAKIKESIDSFK